MERRTMARVGKNNPSLDDPLPQLSLKLQNYIHPAIWTRLWWYRVLDEGVAKVNFVLPAPDRHPRHLKDWAQKYKRHTDQPTSSALMPDPSRSSSTRCPLYAPDQIKVIFDKNWIFAQLINHQHLKLHNTQTSFCYFDSGKDLIRTYSPSGRSFCPAGYWISLPASLGHLNVGRGGFFWQESLFDQNQPCCSHIEEGVGGFSSVAEVVDNNLKVCVFYQESISYSNW